MPEILHLTNDDEPSRLGRRSVRIERTDLHVGDQQAALASVDPPLTGDGWGVGTNSVILVSRTRGVSIQQIIDEPGRRPGRVFVCRYLGDAVKLPSRFGRSDVAIEFWGLLA